jgi:hypothetical protein
MDFKVTKVSFSKNSPWMVTLTHRKERIYRKFFKTKQRAKNFIDEEEAKIDLGLSEEQSSSMGLQHAIELFLEDCITSNLRPTSINTYTQRLTKFLKWKGDCRITEVSRKDIKQFAETSHNKHTRLAYRNDSAYLMNWCGMKEWIPEGGFYNIKLREVLVDEREIPILTADRAYDILHAMPVAHRLRTALQMFAGLRPFEACRVEYVTVEKIIIKGEEAKGRRSRTLSDLPCNLIEWIQDFKVKPCSYNAYRLAREKSAGSLGHDAMRHSFCTYGYWVLGQEKTMRYTGHTNHRTFHHHYCEQNITQKQADFWFKVTP